MEAQSVVVEGENSVLPLFLSQRIWVTGYVTVNFHLRTHLILKVDCDKIPSFPWHVYNVVKYVLKDGEVLFPGLQKSLLSQLIWRYACVLKYSTYNIYIYMVF